jgi:hypothetical protein
MEPAKLGTVMDWPYPTNQKELSCFLGYLNFYRKFINQFSALVAPLTTLTQDKVDTVKELLSAESHDLFERLKLCFKSAPLLQHFDFAKARVLHVDSSKYALLAVLSQRCGVPNMSQIFNFSFYLFFSHFFSLSYFFSYIHSDILRYY